MNTGAKTFLITGADGYIGSRLVGSLLAEGNDVIAWVRADDLDEYESKRDLLRTRLNCASLRVLSGNLRANSPFADALQIKSNITHIIHSAAVTRFNVEAEIADAVNVQGTAKLIDFARTCPRLEQFLLVSSVYSTGLRSGTICESGYDAPREGFSNHYERSKWSNERDVLASGLPWRIARVSTVVSDSVNGEVSQFNAVHNTLKLFYYGMLSIIPGHEDTRLYFVTGDFVTSAISSIIKSGSDSTCYNVCHKSSDSICLNDFVQQAYATFLQDENFKKRRILPPLYSDIESFLALSDSMVHFGQGIMSQASASISPFARQLFVRKDVSNDNMRALLPDYSAPDSLELVAALSRWLIQNKWGRTKVVAA